MSERILLAGDHFVLPSLLRDALVAATRDDGYELSELMLPWPHTPFAPVAEVDEASGSEEQLIEALDGVRVCLTQLAPLTTRMLEACPALELFCVSRGGPVNANVEAATRHGVAVTFAPGRNAAATAEHTLTLLLAAARSLPELHADTARGVWRGDYYDYDRCGLEIEGTTVGLVGFGAIGRRVARALVALDARVLVHDPYVSPADVAGLAELVDLESLLRRSRVVSLHARVTPETTGLIGREQLALMPPGSRLVNCARGALVDYAAVCAALESGQLGGAAFDVFDEEPVPASSPLLRAPNLVLTPHVAGASKQVAHKAAAIIAYDAARYLRGEQPLHCANPEALGVQQ